MMHVSQIAMLYALNLSSTACQLYLSKSERKKKEKKVYFESPSSSVHILMIYIKPQIKLLLDRDTLS